MFKVTYINEFGNPMTGEFHDRAAGEFVFEQALAQDKTDPKFYRRSMDETRWILEKSYYPDNYNGAAL